MSKPMLVTLPFVLLLLDFWPLRRLDASRANRATGALLVLEKIPFLLLAAASSVITIIVQRQGGTVQTQANFPVAGRIGSAFVAYARYLGKTFWPENLAVYYPHPGHWPWVQVITAAILTGGLCFIAWWLRRRFPFVFIGWFWFFGMMIPVIGLVQAGDQSLADRYTYLPLTGLFIAVVWSANEIVQPTTEACHWIFDSCRLGGRITPSGPRTS